MQNIIQQILFGKRILLPSGGHSEVLDWNTLISAVFTPETLGLA